jgi:5-formyltetrahydrofolate cyclo-ligase
MKNWSDIKVWRKTQRENLIDARVTLPHDRRKVKNEQITTLLESGFAWPPGTVVGFCWPYKAEFDARFVIRQWRGKGAVGALPAVVQKAHPLQFRQWWPGARMAPGVYGIPVPVGTETLLPDVAVVPMNGFDEAGYRLGYGGGYFDRTLAALDRRVIAIGVSYDALRLTTIYPQPHDIPMDFIVTETGIYCAGNKKLARLDTMECMRQMELLLISRNLPHQRVTNISS